MSLRKTQSKCFTCIFGYLKILLLTYTALNGLAPDYLRDLLVPNCPSRTHRSENAGLLVLPGASEIMLGGRASAIEPPSLSSLLLPIVKNGVRRSRNCKASDGKGCLCCCLSVSGLSVVVGIVSSRPSSWWCWTSVHHPLVCCHRPRLTSVHHPLVMLP